ncbi:MAG: response regulator [Planctomycetota bacterium]
MTSQPTRILCVDDHDLLVNGLRARFDLESDLKCVGHLPSAEQLLHTVVEDPPDIILLDIEMPGPDPFEAADDIRRQHPGTRVIFLSAHIRDHYISAAVRAGAWGYFSKSDDTDSIVDGIRAVVRGRFAFGPKVQERCKPTNGRRRGEMTPPNTKLDMLSPREQEVLRLIGRGMTRSQIALALCRSPKTVDGHREKIMEKLDIHARGELVRFAIREGLVEV